MTTGLRANITGVPNFYRDAEAGTLPAVSFVRPYEPYSGHPAYSAVAGFEYFVVSISNSVIKHRVLFSIAFTVCWKKDIWDVTRARPRS